jgi:tRNA(adenine34) deaminase
MAERAALWETLGEPWRVCLALAWESYRQGSLPIAAVIVDERGEIVARGRNRLRDHDGAANALHRHPLAHAEVNALLDFPFAERSASTCTMLTTTEPCPLCVGAVRMSGLGGLTYASRDAWAGSASLFDTVPFIRERDIRVASLAGSHLETCLIALQTDAHLRVSRPRKDQLRFLEVWREVVPVGVAAGEQLFASGRLLALAQAGADVREVVAVIEQVAKSAN